MNKQKILIADDSEINRALLIEILENQYDIVEAENGVEAIALLSRYKTEFSLLLLDIMMPKMDGFEVLAFIKKRSWNASLAVIMISADNSPANIKQALAIFLDNALRYAPPGTAVELRCRAETGRIVWTVARAISPLAVAGPSAIT